MAENNEVPVTHQKFIVLMSEDGDTAAAVDRTTGKTLSMFRGEGHANAAHEYVEQLNNEEESGGDVE